MWKVKFLCCLFINIALLGKLNFAADVILNYVKDKIVCRTMFTYYSEESRGLQMAFVTDLQDQTTSCPNLKVNGMVHLFIYLRMAEI